MATIKLLDESLVESKFSGAKATQDSIQAVALWMLNQKLQCDQIVGMWLKVLKTTKIERRLTLFYICNEIVQTCRRNHALVYKDAFKEVLKDAALLVRYVYNTTVEASKSKLLSEFKKRKKLTTFNADINMQQISKLIKDRQQGKQYIHQIEDNHESLSQYIEGGQTLITDRVALIDQLECAMLYYSDQYKDARIVTNAYKHFSGRVKAIKKKLDEQIKILPPPMSPLGSPCSSPPVPDFIPPLPPDTATTTAAATAATTAATTAAVGSCSKDDMELVDMDVSDGETENDNNGSAAAKTVAAAVVAAVTTASSSTSATALRDELNTLQHQQHLIHQLFYQQQQPPPPQQQQRLQHQQQQLSFIGGFRNLNTFTDPLLLKINPNLGAHFSEITPTHHLAPFLPPPPPPDDDDDVTVANGNGRTKESTVGNGMDVKINSTKAAINPVINDNLNTGSIVTACNSSDNHTTTTTNNNNHNNNDNNNNNNSETIATKKVLLPSPQMTSAAAACTIATSSSTSSSSTSSSLSLATSSSSSSLLPPPLPPILLTLSSSSLSSLSPFPSSSATSASSSASSSSSSAAAASSSSSSLSSSSSASSVNLDPMSLLKKFLAHNQTTEAVQQRNDYCVSDASNTEVMPSNAKLPNILGQVKNNTDPINSLVHDENNSCRDDHDGVMVSRSKLSDVLGQPMNNTNLINTFINNNNNNTNNNNNNNNDVFASNVSNDVLATSKLLSLFDQYKNNNNLSSSFLSSNNNNNNKISNDNSYINNSAAAATVTTLSNFTDGNTTLPPPVINNVSCGAGRSSTNKSLSGIVVEPSLISKVTKLKPDVFDVLKNILDSTKKLNNNNNNNINNSSNSSSNNNNNNNSARNHQLSEAKVYNAVSSLGRGSSFKDYDNDVTADDYGGRSDDSYDDRPYAPRAVTFDYGHNSKVAHSNNNNDNVGGDNDEDDNSGFVYHNNDNIFDNFNNDDDDNGLDDCDGQEEEGVNISPPKVVPPGGPLFAPKLFLEMYLKNKQAPDSDGDVACDATADEENDDAGDDDDYNPVEKKPKMFVGDSQQVIGEDNKNDDDDENYEGDDVANDEGVEVADDMHLNDGDGILQNIPAYHFPNDDFIANCNNNVITRPNLPVQQRQRFNHRPPFVNCSSRPPFSPNEQMPGRMMMRPNFPNFLRGRGPQRPPFFPPRGGPMMRERFVTAPFFNGRPRFPREQLSRGLPPRRFFPR
ncbi:hypothetical protein HELRODRAFT_194041 [Helobdella robusta]|uniref:CID domain-containing protein n=1 Tax=Helobdella robusta TaxID=6412 RepID=T1FVL6_HELRO|nr:hypothetical protein HELRODRAFT_194041 [Helobdella robusta]ESN93510.1 hypothetical protein HELRODRAFT_194041 [Helobdella robusta]